MVAILFVCSSDASVNSYDETSSSYSRGRKGSASSNSSSPIHTPSLSQSHSNPDLTLCWEEGRSEYPEYVIRVYKADQAFKYLLIHRVSTYPKIELKLPIFGNSFFAILLKKTCIPISMGFVVCLQETTAREIVMLSLQEFGISDSSK